VRPYRSLAFSLSRRGGPLCPPDHTRRITSATRGVASSCTSKSAIPYKIEANRLELRLQPTDVVEVARQAVQLMQPLAEEKGLKLELHAEENLTARADPNRLHQVLVNLLSNAIKFTDEGYVRVELGRKKGRIRLVVEDTGCGISPEFLPHLFEPFRQEHEGLEQKHQGVGLGLAIVKRLIDLMGGQITVQSEVGRGTRFEILLPSVEHGPAVS